MLRLSPETDSSQWIHWISGEVQMTSCREWQPSMRDVFMQAVDETSNPAA
jgi:hypothetical protein